MGFIGGFFALASPDKQVKRSLYERWDLHTTPYVTYSNGRSAMAALLRVLSPRTVWLPSYACTALAQAVQATAVRVRYVDIGTDFSPHCATLDAAQAGDVILVIDYFGRNPSEALLHYKTQRPEIIWVEDRAQAMAPAEKHWGDYVLYTPRKLVGVGGGGILASATHPLPPQPIHRTPDPGPEHPAVLRARDTAGTQNALWHAAHQREEAAQQVEEYAMAEKSLALLQQIDADRMAERRYENEHYLRQTLGDLAALPLGEGVPFGYPIHIKRRAELAAYLARHGIFAAHHWPCLPSARADFPETHARAEQLLTLPCDQRYDLSHMQRMVQRVQEWL